MNFIFIIVLRITVNWSDFQVRVKNSRTIHLMIREEWYFDKDAQ
jgi:hypothetical protein